MATQGTTKQQKNAASTEKTGARLLPGAGPAARPYLLTQLLADLGPSETNLSARAVRRIVKTLPVPAGQEVLWADVAFGTRTHGLVLTDRGIFLKDGPAGDEDDDDDSDGASVLDIVRAARPGKRASQADVAPPEAQDYELDGIGYHYLRWENFDPARLSHVDGRPTLDRAEFLDAETFRRIAMACVRINNRRVRARRAGRAAVKGTPLADAGRPVRSVCRASAKATVSWCFDEEGAFKFRAPDGLPCIVEVPLDQYDAALQRMRKRIEAGDVAGVDDPDAAGVLVRCGAYTYLQASNIARTARIPGVSYNERTGSVVCRDPRGLGWWLERWLQVRMGLGADVLDTSDDRAAQVAGTVGADLALGSQASAQAGKDPEALKREQTAAALGGQAVSTAGYALGSTGARVLLSGLGAAAGPLGMIAGMALGDAAAKASVEAFGMARDLIFEPESRVMGRLLGGVVGNVAFEHALTRTETALLNEMLAHAEPAMLQALGAAIQQTDDQEAEIRRFLAPLVSAIRRA